jgi:hypothetical protein
VGNTRAGSNPAFGTNLLCKPVSGPSPLNRPRIVSAEATQMPGNPGRVAGGLRGLSVPGDRNQHLPRPHLRIPEIFSRSSEPAPNPRP